MQPNPNDSIAFSEDIMPNTAKTSTTTNEPSGTSSPVSKSEPKPSRNPDKKSESDVTRQPRQTNGEDPHPIVGEGTVIPHSPFTLESLQRTGKLLAASGYFQDSRDMAQACVKILAGSELGFSPIASMTGIYIVKGKVTFSANLMAAAVSRGGYRYVVQDHTDTTCRIEFFRGRESLGVSEFSMDDAKKAGLAAGDAWKKYPRNMLFARAMSNGARWYCADAFGGQAVYTPEELADTTISIQEETPEDVKIAVGGTD